VLPLLYLHGLSTSDFGPALEQFLGSGHGLSAPTITRLTEQWKDDAEAFNARSLADVDYVYMWSTASTSRFASSRTRCACW
jgi:transposase-like protein